MTEIQCKILVLKMFPLCIVSAALLFNFKLSTSNATVTDLSYDEYLKSLYGNLSLEDEYDYPDRIVGGVAADISEFASAVQVLVRDGDMSSSFAVCAGGIIHSSWVLIAAHCIHGKPSRLIKVRAGTSYFEEGGDVHRVTYYRIYEDFLVTDSNLFYDIAVMKVDPDFNFQNPNVQPATLPTKDFSALETGSVVTLIGWGRFEKYASNPGWPISDVLRKVPNVVIPLEDCPTSAHDPHHAFCTISPDEVLRSGMNGDSGSPVYFEGILVGIHSGGSDVTSVTNDEVLNKHTNVSYFLSWIINAISEVNNEN